MEILYGLLSLFQGVGVILMALYGSAVEIATSSPVGRTLISPDRLPSGSYQNPAPRREGYLGTPAVSGVQCSPYCSNRVTAGFVGSHNDIKQLIMAVLFIGALP